MMTIFMVILGMIDVGSVQCDFIPVLDERRG
jgi:hypothetical protein